VNLQELKEKLEQGFYADNLYDMARLCKDMALESNSPAPFFIMQKIFSGIADYWNGRPVNVEEARLVETEMAISLRELIDAIEAEASDEQICNVLNRAVSSYLFLFK
jgi:hypothetical protein